MGGLVRNFARSFKIIRTRTRSRKKELYDEPGKDGCNHDTYIYMVSPRLLFSSPFKQFCVLAIHMHACIVRFMSCRRMFRMQNYESVFKTPSGTCQKHMYVYRIF